MVETITEEASPRPKSMKLSLNVSDVLGRRLRQLAFNMRLSESSVVDVALKLLFSDRDDDEIESLLKDNGACLRRKAVRAA